MVRMYPYKEAPGRYIVWVDRVRFVFKRQRSAERFCHAALYASEVIEADGFVELRP